MGEEEAEANSSDEEAIPSATKLKTVEREASYVIIASPGEIFRLPRVGSYGCWMGRKRDFRDATGFDAKPPDKPLHPRMQAMLPKASDDDSESGEASSAHAGDGEEPWYEATWSLEGSGFGLQRDGAGEPEASQIDPATGLNLNTTLYDFIRERM